MSELHEPDLDRAFAALTTDVAARPSGCGAQAAMETARKRRRTRVGVVGVAAAVIMAGVAVPLLVGDDPGTPVANGRDLSAAAPLSADSLTEASRGWTGPWADLSEANAPSLDGLDSECLSKVGGPAADPQRVGDRAYVSDDALAIALFADFGAGTAGAPQFATSFDQAMSACGAQTSASSYGGVEVSRASGVGGTRSDGDEFWFMRLGQQVAMVAFLGTDTPAPADAVSKLTATFVAALRDDSSYEGSSGALTANVEQGPSDVVPSHFAGISLAQIREATGDWSADWTNAGAPEPARPPCFPEPWPTSSAWGQGSSIGDRGTLAFFEAADPATEIQGLLGTLASCNSTQWTVHDGAGAQGTGAWASYDGGSLFLAERGGVIGYLQVDGLGTPSDQDATNLIGLLTESLANPTAMSEAPQPGSDVTSEAAGESP